MSGTTSTCEGCHLKIDANERGVVGAVDLEVVRTLGDVQTVQQRSVLFHRACYLESGPRYRLAKAQ
jgi:hypothetical protein